MNDAEARMAALRQRFVASAAEQASALRAALRADDRERAIRIAHHLAGASGIFGQPALGELASRLEQAIETGIDLALIEPLAVDILSAINRLSPPH